MKLKDIIGSVAAKFAALALVCGFAADALATPVAKVDSTEYETMSEAIAAWESGSMLTLLADYTIEDGVTFSVSEGATLSIEDGVHLYVFGTFQNDGTVIGGSDAIEIRTMVYNTTDVRSYEDGTSWTVKATLNGKYEGAGTVGDGTLIYKISINGGSSWFTDEKNGETVAYVPNGTSDGTKFLSNGDMTAVFGNMKMLASKSIYILKNIDLIANTDSYSAALYLYSARNVVIYGNGNTIKLVGNNGSSSSFDMVKIAGSQYELSMYDLTLDNNKVGTHVIEIMKKGFVTNFVKLYNVILKNPRSSWYNGIKYTDSDTTTAQWALKIYDCEMPSFSGPYKALAYIYGDKTVIQSLANLKKANTTIYGGKFGINPSTSLAEGKSVYVDDENYYVIGSLDSYGGTVTSGSSVISYTTANAAIRNGSGKTITIFEPADASVSLASGTTTLLIESGASYTGSVSLTGTSGSFIVKFNEDVGYYGNVKATRSGYRIHLTETETDGVVTRTYAVQSNTAITEANAEAQIVSGATTNYYGSVYDAFFSVDGNTEGKTITLLKDVSNAGILTNGKAVNEAGKTVVTFDLNGHSFGLQSAGTGNDADYELTVVDSSEDKTGKVTNTKFSLLKIALTGTGDYSGKYTLIVKGGKWRFNPEAIEYDGNTYDCVPNGFEVTTVVEDDITWYMVGEVPPPVATIDDKTYDTIEAVIEDVADSTPVEITADTTIGTATIEAGSTVTTTSGTASEATATPQGGGDPVTTTVTPKTVTIEKTGEETKTVAAYVVSQGSGESARQSVVTDVAKDETVVSTDANKTDVSDFVDVGKVLANAVADNDIDASTVTSMELSLSNTEKEGTEQGLSAALVAAIESATKAFEVHPVATITTTTTEGNTTTTDTATYEVQNAELAADASFTFTLDFGVGNAGKAVTLTHYTSDGTQKGDSWVETVGADGLVSVTLESFSYLLGTVAETSYYVTTVNGRYEVTTTAPAGTQTAYASEEDAVAAYQASAVAKIGTKYYKTLADAIAAVPTTGASTTVAMVNNSSGEANVIIAATKNVVLDLNGKTVSATAAGGEWHLIVNRGVLTVQDSVGGGAITAAGSCSSELSVIYNIGGTLNLVSGTISYTGNWYIGYAVCNSSNAWGVNDDKVAVFNMTGGTISAPSGDAALRVYQNCAAVLDPVSTNHVNITGGTVDNNGIFVDTYLYQSGSTLPEGVYDGSNIDVSINISGNVVFRGLIDLKIRHTYNTKLNIAGGTFENFKLGIRRYEPEWSSAIQYPAYPLVDISGGAFTFKTDSDARIFASWKLYANYTTEDWADYRAAFKVTGGVFNVDLNNYDTIVFDEGKTGVENTDPETSAAYQFTVGKLPVAQIVETDVTYFTLAAAIDAAQDGQTVKLLADITEVGTVKIEKSVTIDGNDKVLTITGGNAANKVFYALHVSDENVGRKLSVSVKNLTLTSVGYQVAIMAGGDYNSEVALEKVNVTCDGECVYANGHVAVTADDCEFLHEGVYATGKDAVYYSALIVGYGGEISATNCTVTSFGNGVATFPSGGTITLTDVDIAISEESVSEQNAGYALFAWNDDYKTYPEYCKDSVITFNSGKVKGGFKIVDKYPRGDANNKYDAISHINGGIFSESPANINGVVIKAGYEVVANTDTETNDAYPYMVDRKLEVIAAADGTVELSKNVDSGYTFQKKVGTGEWKAVTAMQVVESESELPASGATQTYHFQFVKSGETAVPVGNTVGILHVADSQTNKTTIIGVPWFALGEKITVDSIVYLGNREAGDKISAYDSEKSRYWTWELKQGENGLAWESVYSTTSESTAEAPAANTFELKRGQGLFLERKVPTNPIYLVGRVAEAGETTESTTLPAGSSATPTWTLVAAPAATDLDLNTANPVANPGSDTIVVTTTGAGINVPYTYANGKWGCPKSVQKTRGKITYWATERNENAKVPAGTGFWYLNTGSEKSAQWK